MKDERAINVKSALAEIRRAVRRQDDETAHQLEKKLWERVLDELARRGEPLAAEALKSKQIRFARHYA
jgi:hypothetical protein